MATIETAYYVPTFFGLSTTFGISCAVSFTCIIAFEICKRLDSMKYLFSARTQLLENAMPKQPSHLFSWVTSTFYLEEIEFINKVGLDATMHIRFLRMTTHFLMAQSMIVCPILLTLHWLAPLIFNASQEVIVANESNLPFSKHDLISGNDTTTTASSSSSNSSSRSALFALLPLSSEEMMTSKLPSHKPENTTNTTTIITASDYFFQSNSTLHRLSIASIPNQSSLVWIHVVFVFSITLCWLWLLFVNYLHHIDLWQQQQQTVKGECLHSRSVLVTHIPPHLRNQVALQEHFEGANKIGEVEDIKLISNTIIQLLQSTLKRRDKKMDQLESRLIHIVRIAMMHHHDKPLPFVENNRVVWFDWLSYIKQECISLSLESNIKGIQLLLKQIDDLGKEINQLRDNNHLFSKYDTPTGSAFVTFKTAHSAHMCAQIVTLWKPGVLDTCMAPEPRDILWRSLLRRGRKSRIMGTFRQCIVFAAVWSLTVFWLFPITFILGLTSIETLSNHVPFLRYFLTSSFIARSFIQNILPTLLVTLFMSLLPWIVLVISKQEDFISYSELEDCVLGRYYHFAIFNVLIVFLLGTTFLTTMLDVLYEPTMLIQLLANALPQGANFFLNYILFNSSTHAIELIQLGSQLFGHFIFIQPIFSRTPRMRLRYNSPWFFSYYYYYPNHILCLVIAVTYSVIQPLILLFSFFYFAIALMVYRHQYMYCYVRRYETNGSRHYHRVVRYTSDGLLIFQFTMMGLLYLKGVPSAATSILPLIIFTIWVKIKLNCLIQHFKTHPYMNRFQQRSDSQEASVRGGRGFLCWWKYVDDIWKFYYLRAWWVSGRYACLSRHFIQTPKEEDDLIMNSIRESIISMHQSEATATDYTSSHRNVSSSSTSTSSSYSGGVAAVTEVNNNNGDDNDIVISITDSNYCSFKAIEKIISESNQVNYVDEEYPYLAEKNTSFVNIDNSSHDNVTSSRYILSENEKYQRYHDFTVYPNDSISVHETYEHPALITPFISDLILPINPNLFYWNLKECVYVSLEIIQAIFKT